MSLSKHLLYQVNVHHRINLAGKVDTTDRARMLMVVVSRLLHLSLDCLIAVVQFKVALRNFSSVKHFKTELTAVSSIHIYLDLRHQFHHQLSRIRSHCPPPPPPIFVTLIIV